MFRLSNLFKNSKFLVSKFFLKLLKSDLLLKLEISLFMFPKLQRPFPVMESFLPNLSFFSSNNTYKFLSFSFSANAHITPDAPAPIIVTSYI